MPPSLANLEHSVLVVVDIQPTFLRPIWEADRVLERSAFLMRVAQVLNVPVLATEQNPARMGGTHQDIQRWLPINPWPKMAFSCAGCPDFMAALEASGRKQVVLIGIETHICVGQTALQLIELGYEVIAAEDAVSARSEDRHRIGMARMARAGTIVAHSESIVYEWMRTADHPGFREVLSIVKEFDSVAEVAR